MRHARHARRSLLAALALGLAAMLAPAGESAGLAAEAAASAAAGAACGLTPDSPLQARLDCRPAGTLRIATYNASLNRARAGELVADLSGRDDPQARTIAAVIQQVRPDVLLVNEFDYDDAQAALRLFAVNYLEVAQRGAAPLRFPWRFTAAVNTGAPSGLDLDHDGRVDGPNDALGFGRFPGQYGMAVYSRLPLDAAGVRTFQLLPWRSMPGADWPPGWYGPEAQAVLRLSSKSHWDLPLRLPGGGTLHFLVSHPTPPAFDGPEDRNGHRNHDEIRFWADYLDPQRAAWIVDDRGRRGGLAPSAAFVLAGDLNADPLDGDSAAHAVLQLLAHPRIDASVVPVSAGGADAARRQDAANAAQRGDPHQDTADFGERGGGPGNLRTDYVLPARGLAVCNAGVFWPRGDEPLFALVDDDVAASSDHRLVWIDLAPRGRCAP